MSAANQILRLDGKVALITGAASGMGREACVVFAAEGARVAALDVDVPGLDSTADATRAVGGEIVTFATDVVDEAQVGRAVGGAVEAFGSLHILYNNAGVLWRDRDVSVLHTDEDIWDRVFAINLKGMVWVCKHGVPKLIEVARTHRNPAVKKQAMFWLGQSRDPRALAFFEEVLR